MGIRAWAIILAAFGAAAIAVPARAEPANLVRQSEGYIYFNQPGSDMPALYGELNRCAAIVTGAYQGGYGYGPVQGLAGYLIASAMLNGMAMVSIENCMVVRGWRVVRVDDAEGAELARLRPAELASRLAPWTGAETPHGVIVRRWDNDVAKVGTIMSAFPNMTAKRSLSQLSVPDLPKEDQAATPLRPRPDWPERTAILRPSSAEQLTNIPADSTVLVVTLRNSAPKDFTRIKLLRIGPDGHDPASFTDKRPDTVWLALPKTMKGAPPGAPVSMTRSYVVPAGRWAVYGVSDVLTVCIAAPYFDAGAGEVVHTGALDFGADGIPIDASLEPAKAELASHPELQGRVRAAKWVNGAEITCRGGYAYALEFPWAPYAEGYVRAGTHPPSPVGR